MLTLLREEEGKEGEKGALASFPCGGPRPLFTPPSIVHHGLTHNCSLCSASSALNTQSWWGSRPPPLQRARRSKARRSFLPHWPHPDHSLGQPRLAASPDGKHTLGVLGGSHSSLYSPHRIKQAVKCPQVPWGGGCLPEPLPLSIKYTPCFESLSLISRCIRRQAALRREV